MQNKTYLVAALIAIAALAAAVFYFWSPAEDEAVIEDATVFTDPTTGQQVSVWFPVDSESAILTGLGYEEVVLPPALAASGARYVNEELGLELWNRGDNVTISRDGEQIFAGNIGGLTDADRLAGGTWMWQATTIGNEVTEPNKTDAFTLVFDQTAKTVTGTTDCNGFRGTYSVGADNALTFGPLAMTKMFCEGSQETEFVTPLADVKSFFFAGSGALVLELDDEGTMLFGKQ